MKKVWIAAACAVVMAIAGAVVTQSVISASCEWLPFLCGDGDPSSGGGGSGAG